MQMADYVLMNNGDFEELYQQVEQVLGPSPSETE
jgi:dephospho-CoA kinase